MTVNTSFTQIGFTFIFYHIFNKIYKYITYDAAFLSIPQYALITCSYILVFVVFCGLNKDEKIL